VCVWTVGQRLVVVRHSTGFYQCSRRNDDARVSVCLACLEEGETSKGHSNYSTVVVVIIVVVMILYSSSSSSSSSSDALLLPLKIGAIKVTRPLTHARAY